MSRAYSAAVGRQNALGDFDRFAPQANHLAIGVADRELSGSFFCSARIDRVVPGDPIASKGGVGYKTVNRVNVRV
jgi:hypothetical protein